MNEVQAIQLIGGTIIVLACVNMILLAIILRGVIWQLKLTTKQLAVCVETTKAFLHVVEGIVQRRQEIDDED